MGDEIYKPNATVEDLAIERAGQQLADPLAVNMLFLQSSLQVAEFESGNPGSGFIHAASKSSMSSTPYSASAFPIVAAAAVVDMGGAASAVGMAAQVASAAPVTFGKTSVGEAATLVALGDKALVKDSELMRQPDQAAALKPLVEPNTAWAEAADFSQLGALLGGVNVVDQNDELMGLIGGLGQNPSPENLQKAIDAVQDQISLLNNTFVPLLDGLNGEVQSHVAVQGLLPSTDLGLSIVDDASDVTSTLNSLVGTVDVGSNPQLASLLNLGNVFDGIASLVGSLPNLDLSPVTNPIIGIVDTIVTPIITPILDPILNPILDPILQPVPEIIDTVLNPILDPILQPVPEIIDTVVNPILDPILQPVPEIIDTVVNPILDPILQPVPEIIDTVVNPIVDPVLEPVTGIVDPILNPVLEPVLSPVTEIVDDLLPDIGLLSGVSSGISSGADSHSSSGVLDGLSGVLNSNK